MSRANIPRIGRTVQILDGPAAVITHVWEQGTRDDYATRVNVRVLPAGETLRSCVLVDDRYTAHAVRDARLGRIGADDPVVYFRDDPDPPTQETAP